MVVFAAVILGLRQSRQKKTLKANPNDRDALLKLFNASDDSFTFEEAAEYGIKYLENNPHDYEIMNLSAYGFAKTKSAPGVRRLLDSRINDLEKIVDDPQRWNEFYSKDNDFKIYAQNIFSYYSSALKAFNDIEQAKYYENKAKAIKSL